MIEDIKVVLRYQQDWSLAFIHKEGNHTAQILVILGLECEIEQIWMEEWPFVIYIDVMALYFHGLTRSFFFFKNINK